MQGCRPPPRLPVICLLIALSHASAVRAEQAADIAASPQAREAALAARLDDLRQAEPDPALRDWVRTLVDYAEHSRIAHPERGLADLPRYDIQARARQLLRLWDEQAALVSLQSVPLKALQDPQNDTERRARRRWLQELEPAHLALIAPQLKRGDLDEESLRILVQRLDLSADWRRLLQQGRQRQTVELLASALPQLSAAMAEEFLALAGRNPALAGAAAILRGRHARFSTSSRTRLLQALENARLDIALVDAAISAGIEDLDATLLTRLQEAAAAPAAAYGLYRLQSERALQGLRVYRESANGLPHLQQEISQWLD